VSLGEGDWWTGKRGSSARGSAKRPLSRGRFVESSQNRIDSGNRYDPCPARGATRLKRADASPYTVCKRFSIHSLPCLCDTRFVIRSITDASLYLHISGARLETCAVSPLACCRLPPPTCFCPGSHLPRARVPLVVWARDFLLCGFLAAVSRPLLAHCFSLCDLRLFVDKRMLLSALLRPHFFWRRSHATGAGVRPWSRPLALLPGQAARAALYQH
jgi:hypothetical protein